MTDLEELVEKGVLLRDVPLGPLTTYKSGGPARYLADVVDRQGLDELVATGVISELPVLVLGRGSNLVVADTGFPGIAIRLGEGFTRVSIDGATVTAGSAVPLPRLARATVEEHLTGLEFFVGVPGSVGGAVKQNAGCFGTETKDRLVTADILDLNTGVVRSPGPDELDLSYRHSNIRPGDLVLEAVFRAKRGDPDAGRAELRRITRWRRDNQPGGTLNAGSVFKNPSGDVSAGELIDSLGLKGLGVGDVTVSTKHANFFVAGPAATSRDILDLVAEVKDRVYQLSGTMLEPEIQFVGFEN